MSRCGSIIRLLAPPFFFQAEDGIREADVTGVQTCALPIWKYCKCPFASAGHLQYFRRNEGLHKGDALGRPAQCGSKGAGGFEAGSRRSCRVGSGASGRSEERRVGKECKQGWERERLMEKRQ